MEILKGKSTDNNQMVKVGLAFVISTCVVAGSVYAYTSYTKNEEEKHYYYDDNGDIWISKVAYDTYNVYNQLQEQGFYSIGKREFADIKELSLDDQIYVCEKYIIDQGVYRDLFFGGEECPVFSCKIDGHNVNYIYEGKDVNGIYSKKSFKVK